METQRTKLESEDDDVVQSQGKQYHQEIVWKNIFLMIILHLLGFYGIFVKFYYIPKWQSIAFNILQVLFNGVGITAGRHRLWSHRSYKAHPSVHIFLTIMAASIYEQSIYIWVRDHRLHHKYSDTDADPYNSRRGFFFSHIGWFFLRKHPDVRTKGSQIDLSDLQANPIVMFEHRWNKAMAAIFTVLIPSTIPILFWGERSEVAIGYCCFWRLLIILHGTWTVNSFAHLYGWRPYDVNIQPAENMIVTFFTGGEGFHNYHHAFPWDYKSAELSNDVYNFTTYFIDALAFFGLVYDRRTPSEEIVKKRIARTGNSLVLRKSVNRMRIFLLATISLLIV